jgi:uncharacterized membrane protein YeaQ/YmgE (transglycosylase-associated protein family)
MIVYLLTLAFVGLVVGGLARLALPGPDPMTVWQTILVGVAGSFIAGLLVLAIYGRGGAGIVLSVVCSTAIVYAIRRSRGGTLRYPAGPRAPRR